MVERMVLTGAAAAACSAEPVTIATIKLVIANAFPNMVSPCRGLGVILALLSQNGLGAADVRDLGFRWYRYPSALVASAPESEGLAVSDAANRCARILAGLDGAMKDRNGQLIRGDQARSVSRSTSAIAS